MINKFNILKTIKDLKITNKTITLDKQLVQQIKPKIFPPVNKTNKVTKLVNELINEQLTLIDLVKKNVIQLNDQAEILHSIELTANLLELIDITNETIIQLTKYHKIYLCNLPKRQKTFFKKKGLTHVKKKTKKNTSKHLNLTYIKNHNQHWLTTLTTNSQNSF